MNGRGVDGRVRAGAAVAVRRAVMADAPDVARIYNEGIVGRQATFETRLRTVDDLTEWFEDDKSRRYPLLVADDAGAVCGWIRASSYRARDCYAGVGDFSVYVGSAAQGRGIGSALMAAFFPACREAGYWKLVSRIFPENLSSLALCHRFGFRTVGTYTRHAQLDGVWRDVVIVECLL